MTPAGAGRQGGIGKQTASRKLLTVLFADIVESTRLVSGRDPEDADHILRSILAPVIDSIHRYGGTVAQMLGDGVMAVFGAPVALEDHALRACLAAQDIAANTSITIDGGAALRFSMRVGAAAGEVVAQVVETGMWTDYRTVGETVHLAAKLQQRAIPGQILLSRDVVDLVPVGLRVVPAGRFALAAEARPQPVYALQAVQAGRRTAMDLLWSRPGPFVGRQRELNGLTAVLASAGHGRGAVTVIEGEAGIGKSRLVSEVLRTGDMACRHVLHWPQQPIRTMGEPDDLERVAQGLIALTDGRTEDAGRAWLAAAAAQRAGALAGAAVQELLGMAPADPVWSSLPPAERLTLAVDGLVGALEALAETQPLLILVEDVHWAGTGIARLLDALEPVTGRAPIHVIATTRPEAGPWRPPSSARRIRLDTLGETAVQTYLDRTLGTDPSLAELKSLVASRGQGIPLYLIESLRVLVDSGAIEGHSGRYRRSGRVTRIDLPPSVRGLLSSRIEALPERLQHLLLKAAAIGPTVDVDLLRDLADFPADAVTTALADLEEAGFVHRTRLIPNLEYGFRHALVQEVAYSQLTREQRRDWHSRIVQALRRRHDHDLPGRLDLLAHHAFQAGNWPLAYVYGLRAGRRAERRSKPDDASRFYTDALAALERLEPSHRVLLRRIDLSIALTRAMLPRGIRQGEEHLRRAGELAAQAGDPVRVARAASVHASYLWSHGDLEEAVRLSRAGLAALEARDCPQTRIQLLIRMAGFLTDQGDFREARDALMVADSMIPPERQYDHFGMAIAGSVGAKALLGRVLAELGDEAGALRTAEQAYAIAEDSGHVFSKVIAGVYFGWTLLILGHARPALPVLENTLGICAAIRSPLHVPKLLGSSGYAHALLGDTDTGLPLLKRSLEIYRSNGLRLYTRQVQLWQARALLLAGQPATALSEARTVLADTRATRQRGYEAWAAWLVAESSLALTRDPGTTRRHARRARTIADACDMTLLSTLCDTTIARAAAAQPAESGEDTALRMGGRR